MTIIIQKQKLFYLKNTRGKEQEGEGKEIFQRVDKACSYIKFRTSTDLIIFYAINEIVRNGIYITCN